MIEPEEELTECELHQKIALESEKELPEGSFVPECDENGLYVSKQCYWEWCWCVINPYGNEVEGTRVLNTEKDALICDEGGKKPPP